MESKFGYSVFVEKKNDTFLEFESLEELLQEFGESYREELVGFFPVGSNVTYEELKKTEEEINWTVAYHKVQEGASYTYQNLVHFNSTLELKRNLDTIIEEAYCGKDHITIYKSQDIVYL